MIHPVYLLLNDSSNITKTGLMCINIYILNSSPGTDCFNPSSLSNPDPLTSPPQEKKWQGFELVLLSHKFVLLL